MPLPVRTYASILLPFVTLLMALIGFLAYQLPVEQARQGEWVVHTHQALHQLDVISQHLAEAENGQRGYLLTGKKDYLLPYSQAMHDIENDVAQFQQLTNDNPRQQAQIPLLRRQLETLLDILKQSIDQNQTLIQEALQRNGPVLYTSDQKDQVKGQLDHMRDEEIRLLAERIKQWHHYSALTSWLFVGSIVLLYLLIVFIYIIVRNEARVRKKLFEREKEETSRLMQIVTVQRDIACHRLNLGAAMQSICEQTRQLTAADGAIVEMLEGSEMVYKTATGSATPYVGLRLQAATSLSGKCIQENKVFKCDDSETDDRVDRAMCLKVGLRSMVVVPLRHEGQAVGVLKVLSSHAYAFKDQHIATLELMATTLSATMNDAIAAQMLQTAHDQLQQANTELSFQKTDLQNANFKLEAFATTDGLTGLKNHRIFQERLAEEFQRATRHKGNLSLILLDVDHFKLFNDSFGHPAGDMVLKKVALTLQEAARATDCVARYGGEEFALVLPETDVAGARVMGERIRRMIMEVAWDLRGITVSVGISTFAEATENAEQLLKSCDEALYKSKGAGRNRVTHAEDKTE